MNILFNTFHHVMKFRQRVLIFGDMGDTILGLGNSGD
jgi:hypothetical protein